MDVSIWLKFASIFCMLREYLYMSMWMWCILESEKSVGFSQTLSLATICIGWSKTTEKKKYEMPVNVKRYKLLVYL